MTNFQQTSAPVRLGLKEYISYGLSNSGGTVVFSALASLVTIFWTDYAGISVMVITQVIAISKILDAISNIVFGYLIQQTKSRWGQARPWMLWMAVPFSLSAVGCFLVPQHASATVQWWFIFLAYNFASTITYTAVDLAEGTLCSMMSRDPAEREKLGSFRLGLCTIGHILAGGLTTVLIKGLGNDQAAWIKVMVIWAVYACAVHLLCFFNCKETVNIQVEAYVHRPPLLQQMKALFRNQYWWWAFLYWGVWATQFASASTTMTYYCRYILLNDGLYTVFFIAEKIMWGVFNLALPAIRRKLGWTIRRVMVTGCVMNVAAHLMLLAFPTSVAVNMVLVCVRGIGVACISSFFNGVIATVTDYGQYKTHQRQEALTFAAASMGEKIFNGLILAFITFLLGVGGFISSTTGGTAQPDSALHMISGLYIWGNVIIYALLALITNCYRLDGREEEISKELQAREARGEL